MSNLIESLDHFLIIFCMKIPSMSPVSSMGSKCNKKLPKTNRLTLSEWEFGLYIQKPAINQMSERDTSLNSVLNVEALLANLIPDQLCTCRVSVYTCTFFSFMINNHKHTSNLACLFQLLFSVHVWADLINNSMWLHSLIFVLPA